MSLIDDVLKGKYFPAKSLNRHKAIMISLFLVLAEFLFFFDLIESYGKGYPDSWVIEIGTMLILFAVYVLFPYILSLKPTIYITLITVISFLFLSLWFEDLNHELSLFYLATVPISLFYFLGVQQAVRWSAVLFVMLMGIAAGLFLGWISLQYSASLIFQVSLGFGVVSLWHYIIETERDTYKNDLSTAMTGQEILFKEVHHRTKNNMQVMMGLLETQSFKVKDPKYKKMFLAHVDRIKAMSVVHENLYNNGNYEKIDMHKYLNELSVNLQKLTPHTILTDIDFVFLNMRTSMSLGLIFNEAVSNAIEHAYTGGVGYIDISFKRIGKQCVLSIKDYGQGFNMHKEYQTLGMTLIEDLSAGLPNGGMNIKVDNGTQIQIYCDIEGE